MSERYSLKHISDEKGLLTKEGLLMKKKAEEKKRYRKPELVKHEKLSAIIAASAAG